MESTESDMAMKESLALLPETEANNNLPKLKQVFSQLIEQSSKDKVVVTITDNG